MANPVRIVLNRAGIGRLLGDRDVRREMSRRAERVADAARSQAQFHSGEPIIEVRPSSGSRGTVRVYMVHPGAVAYEAVHRPLGRALDAAKEG